MDINITRMMNENMFNLSGSIHEHGENAAKITWNNSKNFAARYPLVTEKDKYKLIAFFVSIGFSESEDMQKWPFEDIEALVTQYIAGSIREIEAYDTFEEYSEANGEIFQGDNKEFYIHLEA